MLKKIALVSTVVLSCTAAFQTALVRADERHSMPHSSHDMNGGMHHGKMEISSNQAVPSVTLNVQPDPMGGWNVNVDTTNFKFAPEQVNQTSTASEGHAHLYVNGKKLTRLYSNWYYLDSLPAGKNTITVTLNTNKHQDLFYQGKRIEASKQIMVSPAASKKQ
jgi:hypothetical protein